MKKVMTAAFALSALEFGATVVTAQAENHSGPAKKRTVPQNVRDAAKPPPEWDLAHPGRAGDHVSAALQSASTCTGLKSVCVSDCIALYGGPSTYFEIVRTRWLPYCENVCNFQWEQCKKTGFWEGFLIHRSAERR